MSWVEGQVGLKKLMRAGLETNCCGLASLNDDADDVMWDPMQVFLTSWRRAFILLASVAML